MRDKKGRFVKGHSFYHREETKQRISKASIDRQSAKILSSPEVRAKAVETRKAKGNYKAWNKGKSWAIEVKTKFSESKKKSGISPQTYYTSEIEERRRSRSQTFKHRWKDPKSRLKLLRHLEKLNTASGTQKPNKAESYLLTILHRNFPGEWEYTGNGKVILNGMIPDFFNCNDRKMVIELFGDYWHTQKVKGWKATELGRIMGYNMLGIKCLVIWEHELKQEDMVIEKVKRFLEVNNGQS